MITFDKLRVQRVASLVALAQHYQPITDKVELARRYIHANMLVNVTKGDQELAKEIVESERA